jgi:hypothetical protein
MASHGTTHVDLLLIVVFHTLAILLVVLLILHHHFLLVLLILHRFYQVGILEESCVFGVLGEESGCDVEAIVVFCREKKFLLFFSKVRIRVNPGFLQDLHILL